MKRVKALRNYLFYSLTNKLLIMPPEHFRKLLVKFYNIKITWKEKRRDLRNNYFLICILSLLASYALSENFVKNL